MMSEKNKFIIIDEKPKRKEKPKRGQLTRRPSLPILIVIVGVPMLMVACFFLYVLTTCGCSPPDLELTATEIVRQNATTESQLTVTQRLPHPDDFLTLTSATVSDNSASETVTPTPTLRPAPVFSWASQELPSIAAAAQDDFDAVEILEGIRVRASAYGENCQNCGGAGQTSFGAMTTDFYLIAEVESLDDVDHLSQIIIAAVDVLMALDVELPAQLGYFDITFTEGDESQNVRVMFYQIDAARAQGLTGSELLTALGGLH